LDIGSSYIFLEEGEKASSVYEMTITDANIKPQSIELTRLLPTYIPAAILDMQVSQSAGTLAILSKQELSSLYLYRWFNLTGDNVLLGGSDGCYREPLSSLRLTMTSCLLLPNMVVTMS
jgi:hypothetical protein